MSISSDILCEIKNEHYRCACITYSISLDLTELEQVKSRYLLLQQHLHNHDLHIQCYSKLVYEYITNKSMLTLSDIVSMIQTFTVESQLIDVLQI
jgi:hypothetical protein